MAVRLITAHGSSTHHCSMQLALNDFFGKAISSCLILVCNSMLLNAVQCSSMQFNAAQCSSMQLNAVQCCSMQFNAA
jgi:hypothetical protein